MGGISLYRGGFPELEVRPLGETLSLVMRGDKRKMAHQTGVGGSRWCDKRKRDFVWICRGWSGRWRMLRGWRSSKELLGFSGTILEELGSLVSSRGASPSR